MLSAFFGFIILTVAIHEIEAFRFCRLSKSSRAVGYKGDALNRITARLSFKENSDGSYADNSDVQEVLAKLMSILAARAPAADATSAEVSDENLSVDTIKGKFTEILSKLGASDLSERERAFVNTEANMLIEDASQQGGLQNILNGSNKLLESPRIQTSLYSEAVGPICLVHSSGAIGQAVHAKLKGLGKAIQLKLIDAESLSVMQESEINYAVRDARSIIIAADAQPAEKKSGGWFGVGGDNASDNEMSFVVDDKSLKRLLNAAMNERNKSKNPYEIKVVALGRACKPAKGLASFVGGDTTEFDSEVILQCKQRGIGYSIVKVGAIVEDNAPLPSGGRDRSLSAQLPKLSATEATLALPVYKTPIVFTTSRVESNEVTRKSVAVDALLRSATHTLMNSTTSVLSLEGGGERGGEGGGADAIVSDEQWDDQFLSLVGPELHRIPLRFASEKQVAIRLGRIVEDLKDTTKSGLVTPIEVERYSNGVRILFRPKETSYKSSKEDAAAAAAARSDTISAAAKTPQPKGYISPEMEKKLELEQEKLKAERADAALGTTAVAVSSPAKKTKPLKPEGGLEVIAEGKPYRRVRIKRCNMGPDTVVKEESEAILLKKLTRGIEVLETDYKLMLMLALKNEQSGK